MSFTRRRVCVRGISHAVLLACLLLPCAAANARAASVPAGFYGVNSGGQPLAFAFRPDNLAKPDRRREACRAHPCPRLASRAEGARALAS